MTSEVLGNGGTYHTIGGKQSRSGKFSFSQEESLLQFYSFRACVDFFFFFKLQDCEVPDALCKTMPHREGKCESGWRPPFQGYKQQLLLLCSSQVLPVKVVSQLLVSFSSTRCDQEGADNSKVDPR